MLAKPVSQTFATEDEGRDWARRIEALLDRGVVPEELKARESRPVTITDAIRAWRLTARISVADESYLPTIELRYGAVRISAISYTWAENIVERMKQEHKLAPSTIRHHVGVLARLVDWLVRRDALVTNPLRALPKRYAIYNETDVAVAGVERRDQERDRRLQPGEAGAILGEMEGDALRAVALALETGMRLREVYTITADQVDRPRRTIFLDKTKNGDKRQVPLSSGALEVLADAPKAGWIFPGLYAGGDTRKATFRLSRLFVRAFQRAACADLSFHDLRHEATCRLYERTTLSDVEIAKILGWRSLRMALRYANLRGSSLADKLW
jgi:integrase